MSNAREKFHWVDYVMFALMLAASCAIGIYYAITGSKKQTKEEFLMGNRKLKWLPVAISLLVSYNSAISQLGSPAEVYLYGIQYLMAIIGLGLAMVISAFTFVPLLYKLKLTSSHEYLELRYQSKAVRRVGTSILIASQLIYIGIATFSPAIALETVTGFPMWSSIICVGAVSTFYTTLGGIKAVVWTDTLQSILMFGGMLTIIISGTYKVGSFKQMWTINEVSGRINFFNFSIDPTTRMSFWSLILGRMSAHVTNLSVGQASVQRFSSVSTLKKARMLVLANVPLQLLMDLLVCTAGLVLYSYFSECDPLKDPNPHRKLTSPNQLIPLFVMKVIGSPGIPGLFLASIFSGSLSTVSTCLSSLATVTWEDLLKWKFNNLSDRRTTWVLKLLVFIYGICSIGIAFVVSYLQGSVLQVAMSFINTAISPLMGIFVLGAFFTRTNWLGAILGSVIGFSFTMWMNVGSYLIPGTPPLNTSIAGCIMNGTSFSYSTDTIQDLQPIAGINKLYTVTFLYFPVIGILITILFGIAFSLIIGPFINSIQPADIDDDYLIFPLDRWSRKKTKTQKKDAVETEELHKLT